MIHEWVGYFAAACTTMAFLPQVIKAYRTRHTRDLSYGMLGLSSIGIVAWLTYGVLLKDPPLIVANILTLSLVLALLTLKLYSRD